DGAGKFGAPASVLASVGAPSIAAGDFNGDGKLDLAVANAFAGGVSILQGDGAGGFGAPLNFFTGPGPNSVVVGDFNGDGKPDLAVSNAGSNSLVPGNNVSLLPNACFAPGNLVNTSAASFQSGRLAVESIASAFGANLAATTQVATTLPLPTTLAGVSAKVKDGLGDERLAPPFFVSPGQINYQTPPRSVTGTATVTVVNNNAVVASGVVQISPTSAGLFSANANGQGVAAAVALRIKADGSQTFEAVAQFDQTQNRFIPL